MLLASPCSHIWLARREVYDRLSGYREMTFSEDYDFLLRAATAGFKVSNLPEALMQIRTRPGNISSRLEHRKAHYYIVNLYRERMSHGKDSFSREGYEQAVKSGRVENGVTFGLPTEMRSERGFYPRIAAHCGIFLLAVICIWYRHGKRAIFLLRLRLKTALRTQVHATC